MQLNIRSKNKDNVTDETEELCLIMTDNFLRMFFSNKEVVAVSYVADDTIYTGRDSEACLVSPKTKLRYTQWLENLPPLFRELV